MSENAPDRRAAFSKEWRSDLPDDEPETSLAHPHPRRFSRVNWPLWVGGFIVTLVIFVAVFGPVLAPRDPMQENMIIQVGEGWETPPFPPFTVPGFPLGSDQFGRDVLSRLLWAVRPTVIMVFIVATVRLLLGIAIGLGAGWSTGRLGHALDTAIGAALSVPVLIVALAAIAVVGVEWGIIAFIIGLSITGWVDTARQVREQTQIVKGNLFIEASRALGASDSRILVGHVLRQIMPLIWMLFAFVISSTLLTTAGLGFLGYYIGGDVWVDVDDFVARRLSGKPELGQMLAAAWSEQQVITEPWGMIIAGGAVFIAVLGFNLLGEGLRLRLSLDQEHHSSALSRAAQRVKAWASQRGLWGDGQRTRTGVPGTTRVIRLGVAGLFVAIVAVTMFWWRVQGSARLSEMGPGVPAEGSHGNLWQTERRDPQGTLWTEYQGPANPTIQWILQDTSGFAGGPAVGADETIYIVSGGGTLYALDSQGNTIWQMPMAAGGVGAPALGKDGTIYVADQKGGLSAFSSDGTLGWRYQPEAEAQATTGPTVAADETVYYPSGGRLYAVSPEGTLLWSARAPYGFAPLPPLLYPSGDLVFFLDAAYRTEDGTPYDLEGLAGKAANERYAMGADGQAYYRTQGTIIRWTLGVSGIEIVQSLSKQVPGHPRDIGATPDGIVWATYGVGYNSPDSGVVWLDWNDRVLGHIEYQQAPNRVVAVGPDASVYTCGNRDDASVVCSAAQPGVDSLLWQVTLEQDDKVVGGALVPGRLYVSLEKGALYAIGATASEGETAPVRGVQPRIINANAAIALSTPTAPAAEERVDSTPTATAAPQPTPAATQTMVPQAVVPGDILTYTLDIINNGPSTAAGVSVTDTLPPGVTLISATSSHGAGCGTAGATIACQLGDLAAGASASITLTVSTDALTEGIFTNTAVVTSGSADPNPLDNRIAQQTHVSLGADLTIGHIDRRDPVLAGTALTYTLVVTNHGPANATNVILIDALPPAVILASVAGERDALCGSREGRSVRCSLSELPRDTSATFTVAVKIAPLITGTITNTATVTAAEVDPFPLNNETVERTSIRSETEGSTTP